MPGENKKPGEKPAPRAATAPDKATIYLLAVVVAIIAAAAIFLYLQPKAEPEVSLNDFKGLLNSTQNVAIFQDLRTLPAGDADARLKMQNCGIQLSFILSSLGKSVSNYAVEGESCYGGQSATARSVPDCMAEVRSESRLPFAILFNSTGNKTLLTAHGAYYYGDSAFLTDCAITGLIR